MRSWLRYRSFRRLYRARSTAMVRVTRKGRAKDRIWVAVRVGAGRQLAAADAPSTIGRSSLCSPPPAVESEGAGDGTGVDVELPTAESEAAARAVCAATWSLMAASHPCMVELTSDHSAACIIATVATVATSSAVATFAASTSVVGPSTASTSTVSIASTASAALAAGATLQSPTTAFID